MKREYGDRRSKYGSRKWYRARRLVWPTVIGHIFIHAVPRGGKLCGKRCVVLVLRLNVFHRV